MPDPDWGDKNLKRKSSTIEIDALWHRDQLDKSRIINVHALTRIVVAVDPPVTSHEKSDACGIIVAGLSEQEQGFVLSDETVEKASPLKWARAAVAAYHRFEADRIVVEVNQGGEMVETLIRQVDASVAIRPVRATRGKYIRAEPVAALYEQGRVRHVGALLCWKTNCAILAPAACQTTKAPTVLMRWSGR